MKALHRVRVLPMDEGWLDMAVSVPLMDTTRAKTELGWRPMVSVAEALAELIEGMSSGRGRGSVPVRPHVSQVAEAISFERRWLDELMQA